MRNGPITVAIIVSSFLAYAQLQANDDLGNHGVKPQVEIEAMRPIPIVKRAPISECKIWIRYSGELTPTGAELNAEVLESLSPIELDEAMLEEITHYVLARTPKSFETGKFGGEFIYELNSCQDQSIDPQQPNSSLIRPA